MGSDGRADRFAVDEVFRMSCWRDPSPAYLELCRGRMQELPKEQEDLVRAQLPSCGGDRVSAVLRTYTEETPAIYKQVNASLMSGEAQDVSRTAAFTYQLREAIKQRLPQRQCRAPVLWRGASMDPAFLQSFPVFNHRFVWPGFVSTSHSRAVAEGFMHFRAEEGKDKVLFKIHTEGVGTTYILDIADVSRYPHEQEALIYPNSGFELIRVEQRSGYTLVVMQTYDSQRYRAERQRGEIHHSSSIFLRAEITGKCVDVEGIDVRTRWAEKLGWQTLEIQRDGGGSGCLQEGDVVFLRTHTGKYIDVENGEKPVQARWDDRGLWQRFIIWKKQRGPLFDGREIRYGDHVFFIAHTGDIVDVNPDGIVVAHDPDDHYPAQCFIIELQGDCPWVSNPPL